MAPLIKLKSSDGEIFQVDLQTACKSQVLDTMLDLFGVNEEDKDEDDDVIPILKVNGRILRTVLEWAQHHKNDGDDERVVHIGEWDRQFLDVDLHTLNELQQASDYMDIRGLLALLNANMANMINNQVKDFWLKLRETCI